MSLAEYIGDWPQITTLVGGGDFSDDTGYGLKLRGDAIENTRAAGLVDLRGNNGSLSLVQVKSADKLNASVTWTNGGTDGLWNATSENWIGDDDPNVTKFLHGDEVTFEGELAGGGDTITIGDGGVLTNGLLFQAGVWDLKGGSITAKEALNIDQAMVDLTGITGDNAFNGLVISNGGRLTVANEQQLGLTLDGLELNEGALAITGPARFHNTGGSEQRLEIKLGSTGNSLNLDGPLAEVIISHNTKTGGFGGALWVGEDGGLSQTAEDGGSLVFQDNQAAYGGAVYNLGHLTLTNAGFYNNTGTSDGGAIFLDSASTTILAVTEGRTAVFSGNKTLTAANSIFLANSIAHTTTTLTIAAEAGAELDMRDPMTSVTNDADAVIQINKEGHGTWKLAGANDFSTGVGRVNIDIQEGGLSLAAGASIGLGGNNTSTLRIDSGARVDITGLGVELRGGSLMFADNTSVMGFDAAKAQSTGGPAMLNLNTADYTRGAMTIDLLTLPTASGGYLLINSDNSLTGLADAGRLTVNGSLVSGSRADGAFRLDTTTNPNQVVLVNDGTFENKTLIWGGINGGHEWNVTAANWTRNNSPIRFFHGDSVQFGQGGHESVDIAGQMRVADLTVNGGAYTFTGGSILASTGGTTLESPGGSLAVIGGGSEADFSGLTGANSFEGVVQLGNGGRLIISRADQLGISLDRLQFIGTGGTLAIAAGSGEVVFDDAGLNISADSINGAVASIEVAADSTLATTRGFSFNLDNSSGSRIQKLGSGVWELGGLNYFDHANGAGSTGFSLFGGALHLLGPGERIGADPGVLHLGTGLGSFFEAGAATLSVGGANAITADTIEFEANGGTTAAFSEEALTHSSPALALTASVYKNLVAADDTLGFTVSLPETMPSLGAGQSYVLIETTTGTPFAALDDDAVNSVDLTRRVQRVLTTNDGSGGLAVGRQLIVKGVADDNRVLTWTGAADSDWKTGGPLNWITDSADTIFQTCDAVVFDSADDQTINLPATVTAAGMKVTSGTYEFPGQGLTLNTTGFTGLSAADNTGQLVIDGDAETLVDFTELTANSFQNGLVLKGGELKVASAAQLGINNNAANFEFSGGTLTAEESLVLTGLLNLTGAAGRTLKVENGKSLNLTGGLGSNGGGKLTKDGPGQLGLGATTAAGLDLTVAEGSLRLDGNLSLSAFTLAGGTMLTGLNSTAKTITAGKLTLASNSYLHFNLSGLTPGDAAILTLAAGTLALDEALSLVTESVTVADRQYALINAGQSGVFNSWNLTLKPINDAPPWTTPSWNWPPTPPGNTCIRLNATRITTSRPSSGTATARPTPGGATRPAKTGC